MDLRGGGPAKGTALLTVPLAATSLGVAGGLLGVLFGMGRLLRETLTPDERRRVLALRAAAVADTVLFLIGLGVAFALHSTRLMNAMVALFALATASLYGMGLPRLQLEIAKRHGAADLKTLRARSWRIGLGWALGLAVGATAWTWVVYRPLALWCGLLVGALGVESTLMFLYRPRSR